MKTETQVGKIWMKFGQLLQKRRAERGLTLHGLERSFNVDAGRLCKIENGVLPPPVGEDALGELAKAYGFEASDPEYLLLLDLSAAETGRVPLDLQASRESWLELFSLMRLAAKKPKKFEKFLELVRQTLNE